MNVHNSVKNKSKEDTQTAQITLKKLAIHMQEFDLLKYPASSFPPPFTLRSPLPLLSRSSLATISSSVFFLWSNVCIRYQGLESFSRISSHMLCVVLIDANNKFQIMKGMFASSLKIEFINFKL